MSHKQSSFTFPKGAGTFSKRIRNTDIGSSNNNPGPGLYSSQIKEINRGMKFPQSKRKTDFSLNNQTPSADKYSPIYHLAFK